jgi:Zn ribbon nucleic-acid-binding protein
MRLITWIYECGNCLRAFECPDLPEGVYGEATMRSDTGRRAYIDLVDLPELSEVLDILKEMTPGIAEPRLYELSNYAFPAACDVAPDGTRYQFNKFPSCPRCGSVNILNWNPKEPVEIVECDMPTITHAVWRGLSDEEKKQRVRNAIKAPGGG